METYVLPTDRKKRNKQRFARPRSRRIRTYFCARPLYVQASRGLNSQFFILLLFMIQHDPTFLNPPPPLSELPSHSWWKGDYRYCRHLELVCLIHYCSATLDGCRRRRARADGFSCKIQSDGKLHRFRLVRLRICGDQQLNK